MKKIKVHAVETIREIRDQQAEKLAGKPPEEVIAFFRQAGKSSLQAVGARRRKKVS